MKRSSVKPYIENFGETGCLEPAFNQNTNDDDGNLSFKKVSELPASIVEGILLCKLFQCFCSQLLWSD